jgi:EAL domain-containing protein (putative c-di-GMP-specific phosphodiesterase class I)/anti-sigma regulatory factor (Ser/Thr protein kinase)
VAGSEGDLERRARARRLTDVHLPRADRHRTGGSSNGGSRPRRWALVFILCAPAVALLAWLEILLLDAGRPLLAVVALLVALAWLVCLAPMLGGGSRSWTLTDVRRMRIVHAVRRALERDELVLHYQPQMNIQSGGPSGVEALLRWRRNGELIPPGDFLPAVESSELIGPLTQRVLEMALEQTGAWQRAGRPVRVAVNLSPANLADFRIVDQLERSLAKYEVSPELLILEVTETTVLENPEQTRAILDAITDLGVAISVDDFGIGYSSLLWLRIFPVDEVKIDRSFVSQMHGDGKAFVEGVIRLARDLSMTVVAEGIEEESTLEQLQALGCESGQGFLFSPAMPPAEVEAWIDSHHETSWARRETTISIDPEFDQIGKARDLVADRAIKAGMSESDVWDMRVAVTEALANAIEHGPCAADNLIHVRIAEEQGELRLDIAGGGRTGGQAPAPRGPDRGRGLSIMTGTMDSLKLTHDRDRNLIRLAKTLSDRPR